jgi:hypothetical protein
VSKIGSLPWRLKHYGPIRSLKYLYFDVFLPLFGLNSAWELSLDVQETRERISRLSGLTYASVIQIESRARQFLITFQIELEKSNQQVKFGVAGLSGPVGRLTCIGAILKSYRPDAYIETGTQYGVSAEFARQFGIEEGLGTTVISIDVSDSDVVPVNSGYRHILLAPPYGPNLLSELEMMGNTFNSIVFAHDSDHTFEHMKWELFHAYRLLQPKALLCDDIQQHQAFEGFCRETLRQPIVLRYGREPAFGAITFCDPDGT